MPALRTVGGRFEPLRVAGAGGMGKVYEARDLQDGALVALKVLHRSGDVEEERFAREAHALSSIAHPGVVRHVAHGKTDDGEPYLAMEWIRGETLRSRLGSQPLSIADSVTLALRLAEALGAVHSAGIVHRDLKPGNILLADGALDRPVLVDFGIARLPGAGRLTVTGAAIGTPGYMAPEQARGEADLDARADVFALGCLLFRCLTGVEAFGGDHPLQALLRLVLEEAPKVGALRAEIPPALDALVTRLLAKERERRPLDGGVVAAELERIGGAPRSAPPSGLMIGPPPSSKEITSGERRATTLILLRAPQLDPEATPLLGGAGRAGDSAPRVAALHEVARRFRGRVEVLAEDALLLALSSAAAPTDLAARAARCALALRAVLGDVPIAVATGWTETSVRLPMGELIDHALRVLEAAAAPGAGAPILLDEVTARLLGQRFDVAAAAGRAELRGERDDDEPAPLLLGHRTTCVGRDRELLLLESSAAHCVEESSAAAVLITGRPGAGKSRLRQELSRRLRASGVTYEMWIGHGDQLSAGAPFGLLSSALRHALGIGESEPAEAKRARIAAATAGLKDAARVALFLGELLGLHASGDGDPQLRAAQREPLLMGDQLRRAAEDLLRARCEKHLVVLALDDLQWGDLPTVTFADAALRNLSGLPLLVVAFARPEVTALFPHLWEGREVQVLQLGGLPRRAAERLVRQVLGPSVPAEEVARLIERADGNPFYLEELIRAVADGLTASFPETVLAMAEARLAGLDPEARRILRAASVFGRTFVAAGVEALLGGAPAALRLADLAEREVLVRTPLLGRATEGPDGGDAARSAEVELQFRHALLRDAAYGTLTEGDRALGHLLAGQWLESSGRADALTMAEHFERGGDGARAAHFYRRAAEEELQGNDLEAALARAERSIACGIDGQEKGEVLWIQAEAHIWRGELAQAEERARAASELLPVGSASWFRAVGCALLATTKQDAIERLAAWAQLAESAASHPEARSAKACCLAFAAAGMLFAGRYPEVERLLADGIKLADEPPGVDGQAAGGLHQTIALRETAAAELDRALTSVEASLAAFEQAGDRRNSGVARANAGFLRAELGDLAGAEAMLRAALSDAQELGVNEVIAGHQQNIAYVLAHAGKLEEARRLVEQSIAAFRQQGQRRGEGGAQAYLARIALAQGDAALAEAAARAALSLFEVAPPLRAMALALLSSALLAQGRAEDAFAPAQEAFAQLEARGSLEEGEALVRLCYVDALAAVGRDGEAAQVLAAARARLLSRAERIRDPALRQAFLTKVPENAATLSRSAAGRG